MKPTKEQFNQYRRVQFDNKWHMDNNKLDCNARLATGLTKEIYNECIKQYDKLVEEYGECQKEVS